MTTLYNDIGARKYLNDDERKRFLAAARLAPPKVETFCTTLALSGARISEALMLTFGRIDLNDNLIIIPCLKKRRSGVNRIVPLPTETILYLDQVHSIRSAQSNPELLTQPLWGWCRTTGWKHVKGVMKDAKIVGPHATPRALRHSFGVAAVQVQTPITLVQKWLGHSRLSTTAIYTTPLNDEEREIAIRLWRSFDR